jgi:hypothetical protein
MADWQLRINFIDEWDKSNNEETVENLRSLTNKILSELNRIKPAVESRFSDYLDDLNEIIDDFDTTLNDLEQFDPDDYPEYDAFNYALEKLYDWGDIKLDNDWSGKKLCWIGHII